MAKWIFILLAIPLAASTMGGCSHGSNVGANAAHQAHAPAPNPLIQAQNKSLAQQQARQDAAQSKQNWNKLTKTFNGIVGLK